jgi:hypothetical protein
LRRELQRYDRASPALQALIVERLPSRFVAWRNEECVELLGEWLRAGLFARWPLEYSRLQLARLRALTQLNDDDARQAVYEVAALERDDVAPYAALQGERAAPEDGLRWLALQSVGSRRRNLLDGSSWQVPIHLHSRLDRRPSGDLVAMTLRLRTLDQKESKAVLRRLWRSTHALLFARPAPESVDAARCALHAGISRLGRALPERDVDSTLRLIVATRGRLPITDGDAVAAQALAAEARHLLDNVWHDAPSVKCPSVEESTRATVALLSERERQARMTTVASFAEDELASLANDVEASALRDRWMESFVDGDRLVLRSDRRHPGLPAVDARATRPFVFARFLLRAWGLGRIRDERGPVDKGTVSAGQAIAYALDAIGRENGGAMYREPELRAALERIVLLRLDTNSCDDGCEQLLAGLLESGTPAGQALLGSAIASLRGVGVRDAYRRRLLIARMAKRYDFERQADSVLNQSSQN